MVSLVKEIGHHRWIGIFIKKRYDCVPVIPYDLPKLLNSSLGDKEVQCFLKYLLHRCFNVIMIENVCFILFWFVDMYFVTLCTGTES